MDAIDAIMLRRSQRALFGPATLNRADLELVLKCGLAGPSSKNARPWRFHVLDPGPTLVGIAAAMETAEGAATFVPLDPSTEQKRPDWTSTVLESAEVLRNASVAIFVENLGSFGTSRSTVARTSEAVREDAILGLTLEVLGIGAAVQNMWIAATALGLEGAFIGDVLVAEVHVRAALRAAGDIVGVLVLGPSKKAIRKTPRPAVIESEHVVWHEA